MRAGKLRKTWQDVLVFHSQSVSRSKVRRYYEEWRRQNALPTRCDNDKCHFHLAELVWNGKRLKPVLDHRNGNSFDNRPTNLWFLCPNCDSQQSTRGGANRGRVLDLADGKFTLVDRDGKLNSNIFPGTGHLAVVEQSAHLTVTGDAETSPTNRSNRSRVKRAPV